MRFHSNERVALFIDGVALYHAARTLAVDIDYRRLLAVFSGKARLIRALYYTVLPEDQDYSPVRPLIDWLGYNGFTVVTKPARDFADSSGRRKPRASMEVDMAVDMMELGDTLDHVVLFSGDKLLGGPQAGVIAGRADLVQTIGRHPLARALRIDRLSLAALQATLRLHGDPERARTVVPVRRLISTPLAEVQRRAEALAAATGGEVVESAARIGGGALPTVDLPSMACALPDQDGSLHAALRTGEPAILGRIEDGLLLLDCRTLLDDADVAVIAARVNACR